jgi:hypothetical protein
MASSPYSMILLIIAFGFCLFLFILTGYHHILVYKDETTNENLKGTFRATGNPFRRTWVQHWIEICKPRGKGMLWKPKRVPKSITDR